MNYFRTIDRPKIASTVQILLVSACLLSAKFFVQQPADAAPRKYSQDRIVSVDRQPAAVGLTGKQLDAIKIDPAQLRDFQTIKSSVGTIDFNQNKLVQVFSQYPGKIIDARFNVGDEVKQGDVLFTIDSPDLLQAESNLLSSAGQMQLQSRNLARLSQLLKAGGSAQKDVDQAMSDQQTAEGNFRAAKDAVRMFGKSDDDIATILQDRKIDSTLRVGSPIAGRIIARNAASGFLTQPGNSPAPFSVADLSTMWMIANIVETDAILYQVGQPLEVQVPAYPDKSFRGSVTTVGSTIDPVTHRLLVRSEISDPEHLLRAGMFASFLTRIGSPVTSTAVSANAVVREGDGTLTVWVTADRQNFQRRIVTVGISNQAGFAQILSGLSPNELVVSDGGIFLSNKMQINSDG